MIECAVCNTKVSNLADHIREAHNMSLAEYAEKHPKAPLGEHEASFDKGVKRSLPPEEPVVKLWGLPFKVNTKVPASACLPMPSKYRCPSTGDQGKVATNLAVSLYHGRSSYLWGLPGSGKDALFHYFSQATRRPGLFKQMVPGTDIESWFFTRSFDSQGTSWDEGEVLKALRDGYVCEDGTRVPYMVLISDIDRADRSQAEYFRLILDSIDGRVNGPQGKVYDVLPGTLIVATANTSGGGDARGRMISANPIDGSILDRFDRVYEFPYLEWTEEMSILKEKFPLMANVDSSTKTRWFWDPLGRVVETLRKAVTDQMLHGEFTHRSLCTVLGHGEDLLAHFQVRKPVSFVDQVFSVWSNRLPDDDARKFVRSVLDPHYGSLTPEDVIITR